MKILSRALLVLSLCGSALAQDRAATAGQYAFLRRTKLVARFDKNMDGKLDPAERAAARKYIATDPDAQRRRQMERMLSRRSDQLQDDSTAPPEPVRPEDVPQHRGASLYAPDVLRTLFLEFPQKDWLEELIDFYKTDVELPAMLIVDREKYPGVGVRVRGTSSFLMVGNSKKKSFNVSIGHTDPKQRLAGFRTLNLLNGNQDPTFMREVIFSHVASRYLPTPRVNFVKLVINGENWGVYQNAQQFNRDFVKHWYGTGKGVRWKIHRNQRGVGALCYLGEDRAEYEATYEPRGKKSKGAWRRLIQFCKVLNETPAERLPAVLPALLDIDQTLWFCALESVFLPNDGYLNQGYDYRLFEAKDRRFHLIPHDNNEILPQRVRTFTRGDRSTLGLDASPLRGADDPQRPIMSRLLAVPQWRARYLAHVRTLATHWLDWQVLGPVCKSYQELIRAEIYQDDKKLLTNRTFDNSVELQQGVRARSRRPLQWIVTERRQRILAHPSMQGPWPELAEVKHAVVKGHLQVTARVAGATATGGVLLHASADRHRGYRAMAMRDDGSSGDGAAGDGVFGARLPVPRKRTKTWFYVEARTAGVAAFHPAAAEAGPLVR